jgi:membrane protein implicated in regulation of membrane protease activity
MLLDISQWWAGIDSAVEKIYWIIAFPVTLIFIIQTVMTFIGSDVDADGDMDIHHDGDLDGAGFHVLTLKNLVAFFAIFSWTGIAMTQTGVNPFITGILALIAGLVMMFIMASLFYFMSKLTDSGTLNMNNAIGKVGTVYLTLAANKQRQGKVQIKVQNSLQTLNALTEDSEEIKTGSLVEVVDVINENILLVKRKR